MSNQAKPKVVVDQADVKEWVDRFNATLADNTVVTGPAAENAQPWYSPFFGCLTPVDTCKKSSSAISLLAG